MSKIHYTPPSITSPTLLGLRYATKWVFRVPHHSASGHRMPRGWLVRRQVRRDKRDGPRQPQRCQTCRDSCSSLVQGCLHVRLDRPTPLAPKQSLAVLADS